MKIYVPLLSALVAIVAALVWTVPAFSQSPAVLVDTTTAGHYNAALGTALDGTQPQFPCANLLCGDPTINAAPEPNLTSVNSILGGWLSNPPSFGASWSSPQAIPLTWAVNTETAIVYEIDAGACGLKNVSGSFGVDNGIFVWVNGSYKFGALAPGAAIPGEYVVSLGNLPPGTNFVQILREDHGALQGYAVEITGVPKACADDDEDDDGEDDGDNGNGDDDDDNGNGDDDDDNGNGDDDGDNGNGDDDRGRHHGITTIVTRTAVAGGSPLA